MLDDFLTIADLLLSGLLLLPGPLPVIAVAGISAAVMVLLRRFVTDQSRLCRCVADRKRLKQLIRGAKRRKDRPAAQRHRATLHMVQFRILRQEGWPLLLSIPVIGFLGTWGYFRLEYHPPADDEPITLELSLPPSAEGALVTLVPQEGLSGESWIARVTRGEGEPIHGVARWQIQAEARTEPYLLQMRYRDQTFEHSLLVGQRIYAKPVRQHDERFLLPQSVLHMRPTRVLGLIDWLRPTTVTGAILPAWLVTYVLLVVPMVYVLKRTFRVC